MSPGEAMPWVKESDLSQNVLRFNHIQQAKQNSDETIANQSFLQQKAFNAANFYAPHQPLSLPFQKINPAPISQFMDQKSIQANGMSLMQSHINTSQMFHVSQSVGEIVQTFPCDQNALSAPLPVPLTVKTAPTQYNPNAAPMLLMGGMVMQNPYTNQAQPMIHGDNNMNGLNVRQNLHNLIRPANRTSLVWQHFKILASHSRPGRAVCDHCCKEVQHGSSTSNLASHLRIRHADIVSGTPLSRPPPCLGPDKKPRVRKNKVDSSQLSKFEGSLLKWAASTNQNIEALDNDHFKQMIFMANPKLFIPPREKLERAIRLKNLPIDVSAILEKEKYSEISWIAALMSLLKKRIKHAKKFERSTDSLNVYFTQLTNLAKQWGKPQMPKIDVFGLPETPESCLLAALIDPRFKNLKFLEKSEKSKAWVLLWNALQSGNDVFEESKQSFHSNETMTNDMNFEFSKPKCDIEHSLAQNMEDSPSKFDAETVDGKSDEDLVIDRLLEDGDDSGDEGDHQSVVCRGEGLGMTVTNASEFNCEGRQMIHFELMRYKDVRAFPRNIDPFQWWEKYSGTFPHLFKISKKVLGRKFQ